MDSIVVAYKSRVWVKDEFFISTDDSLIPVGKLNAMFETDDVYWAKPLPDNVMRETLKHSLCFGLFKHEGNQPAKAGLKSTVASNPAIMNAETSTSTPILVGIARCITDYSTFVYLTDVFVDPLYQGRGLGTWLVGCVHEVIESMPHLRRSVLFTSNWERSVPFYEKTLGVTLMETKRGDGVAILSRAWKGNPQINRNHD